MKTIQRLNNTLSRHGFDPIKALDLLNEELGIKYSVYEDSLYVLNYDQINSPKSHGITKECRSLVLGVDYVGDQNIPEFVVVSRSFDRFYNYGEVAFPHKINKMTAHEKMDGSLVTLWFDDRLEDVWAYRTRSMIMPELPINNWERTWKDLIETSINYSTHYCGELVKGCDYIFEVTGQENRVVVRYPEDRKATLLAIRRPDGTYKNDYFVDMVAKNFGWNRPRRYEFETVDQVQEAALALPNLEEGYVMYREGKPIGKMKNPAYVAAHHLRGEGLNPKRCLQLVCLGEVDEYVSVFPEDGKLLEPYVNLLERFLEIVDRSYNEVKDVEDQKEFALIVKDWLFSTLMFQMRGKGITAHTAFFNQNEKSQHRLLEMELSRAAYIKDLG